LFTYNKTNNFGYSIKCIFEIDIYISSILGDIYPALLFRIMLVNDTYFIKRNFLQNNTQKNMTLLR